MGLLLSPPYRRRLWPGGGPILPSSEVPGCELRCVLPTADSKNLSGLRRHGWVGWCAADAVRSRSHPGAFLYEWFGAPGPSYHMPATSW